MHGPGLSCRYTRVRGGRGEGGVGGQETDYNTGLFVLLVVVLGVGKFALEARFLRPFC